MQSYSQTFKHDVRGTITYKSGFNIAFALTPYAGDLSKSYEDESKVTMMAELYSWGVPENSLVSKRVYTTLRTHECTEEELGLTKDTQAAKFYPPQPESAIDVKRIVGNWHCLDEEQDTPFDLYGDYDSGTAQALRINIMLCDPTQR